MCGLVMNLHDLIVRRIGILIIFTMSAESMRFDLKSGATKCISEDIKGNAMTVGKYHVVYSNTESFPVPDTHKINVRVNSPHGHSYHYENRVESVVVDFDWKTGIAAKDWSNVAKKGQIEEMELELKKLYETVSSIHDEMFYLRDREEEMQQLNRATNSKMATFSFLSLVVCLSVAGLQLWHLKTFFQRKKVI
ncbi:hypothetical protein I3842_03G019100 [Carya illinoinensis]|uniref:GOLD domain-containing protein n=1 Tax=Carya illinoinensis TaxID=32201 RepID=A0A922FBZ0_CARIL|nr:hypothetical protein I3842_03G019100 [Carya illinoinensis]